MPNVPTGSAGEAVPTDDTRGGNPRPLDDRLCAMNTRELVTVAAGLKLAPAGFDAVYNQPRADGPGGLFLRDEEQRLAWLRSEIFDELRARPADGSKDDGERIRAVIAYDFDECGDGLADTIAALSRMTADHEWAASRKRR